MRGDQLGVPFTGEEYAVRLANVRREMARRGIDVLLLREPANVHYLTGYNTLGLSSFMVLFVTQDQEPKMVARYLETYIASKSSNVTEVRAWDDHENPFEVTREFLRQNNWLNKRIGLEKTCKYLPVSEYEKLIAALGVEVADGSGIVESSRLIKSQTEIEFIRKAAEFTAAGMRSGMEALGVGVSENQVAGAVYEAMASAGSENPSGGPIVTGGWKSGVPHSNFFRLKLQEGDAVLFEHGGAYNRYNAALMRTGVIGPKYDPEIKVMYDICVEALEAAIATIKPGVTSGEVDEACRGIIERAGYYDCFRKRTGYSIGVGYPPSWMEAHIFDLKKDDPRPLQAGMVFHIPPALRKYGQFGVGVSETVLVTETGCESLTQFPRELFVTE